MTPSSQKGGLEAVAVSRSFVSISFLIKILGFFITVSNVIFHKSHNKSYFASYITSFFITQLMTFISLLTHFISFCSHFHWLYHSFWQGSFLQHCHWGKVNINSLYYDEMRFREIHGLVMKGWDGTGIMLVHSGFFSGEYVVNIFANLQSNDFSVFHSFAVRYDLRHLFFSVIWAGLSVAIAAFVRANGRIFCNRPRLHKPRCWFWVRNVMVNSISCEAFPVCFTVLDSLICSPRSLEFTTCKHLLRWCGAFLSSFHSV